MKNILCYGDSNTFGYKPKTGERYSIKERWTGILQELLINENKNEYRIIEEGLNGRTTALDDPAKDGRNGKKFLDICLETHKPLDLIIISLGTNDLKTKFSPSANTISQHIRKLILSIKNYDYGYYNDNKPKIMIVCPAPLGENVHNIELSDFDKNSIEISKELHSKYKLVCELENAYFFDLGSIVKTSEEDHVHLSSESHKIIANSLYQIIKDII